LLPPQPEKSSSSRLIEWLFDQLPPEEQEDALAYLKMKQERVAAKAAAKAAGRNDNPPTTPLKAPSRG